jgi:hypothetical protein
VSITATKTYEPRIGDKVRVRRFVQPGLRGSHPERELQGEWTGTVTSEWGCSLDADAGEYLDFGYVFLGGNPADGTCSYLVTEVETVQP